MVRHIRENNPYFENNPEYFDQLLKLIDSNIKTFTILLEKNIKYRYLRDWLTDSLPLLADNVYQLRTKCYWILNGLTDFPVCPVCGRQDNYIGKNVKLNKGYHVSCCKKCMYKNKDRNNKKYQTMLSKYGGGSPLCSKEILKKAQATSLKNHGAKSSFCKDSDVYSHLFDKLSEKVGKKITNPSQIKEIAEKAKQTKIERYGEAGFDMEKQKATCMERYGSEYYFSTDKFKEQYKKTCLEKYGVENTFQAEECKKKSRQTCSKRYGVEFSCQCPAIRRKGQKKYKYKNISFDSKTEIAYYIYMMDNGYDIHYNHNIFFKYEFEGKQHVYHPDFLVILNAEEQFLVEIKGDQFFNEDGTMKIPYRNKKWTDAEYYRRCQQEEAKHQCMIQHNVKIIRHLSNEMHIIFEYIENKYGKDWHQLFRNQAQQ